MANHILEKLRGLFTWRDTAKVSESSHEVPEIVITEFRQHRTSSILPIYPSDEEHGEEEEEEEQNGKGKGKEKDKGKGKEKYDQLPRPRDPDTSNECISSSSSSAEPITDKKSTVRHERRRFRNSLRTWRHAYLDERERSKALRSLIIRRGQDLDSLLVDMDGVHTSASALNNEVDNILHILVTGFRSGTDEAIDQALMEVANKTDSLGDLKLKVRYHSERIATVARELSGDWAAVALNGVYEPDNEREPDDDESSF